MGAQELGWEVVVVVRLGRGVVVRLAKPTDIPTSPDAHMTNVRGQ